MRQHHPSFSLVEIRPVRRAQSAHGAYWWHRAALLAVAAMTLAGCADQGTLTSLNDASRSVPQPDVASLADGPMILPYETEEIGGIALSYNLSYVRIPRMPSYKLVLIVRNNTGSAQMFEPVISLVDATGVPIAAYDYQTFMADAAWMASAEIPPDTESATTSLSYEYGSGRLNNNPTAPYPAAVSPYAAAPGNGPVQRPLIKSSLPASRAAEERKTGQALIKWADTFWFKGRYFLANHAEATGALLFPAATMRPLPLHLHIEAGGQSFDFLTGTKPIDP